MSLDENINHRELRCTGERKNSVVLGALCGDKTENTGIHRAKMTH